MAKFAEAMLSVLDTTNAVANVYEDYLEKDAKRSTQNKQIQLKDDINKQMMEIQRSSTSDEWEQKMTDYFQNVKSQMSDKNSPYYCKNNLQAEQFDAVLSQAQVTVSNEVSQLVFKADRDKAIVDYRNSLVLLAQNESGQSYIDKANALAKSLFDSGFITRDQYQQQLDTHFDTAYINTATAAFEGTIEEAIKRGDSKETLIKMALDNVENLMGIDTDGLPKTFDKEAMNKTLKKSFEQEYNAYLADYQYQNVQKLAGIYQQMNQATTQQGIIALARQGQLMMNDMPGNALSNNDREEYSRYFKVALDGGLMTGSGSGGGGSKATESVADFMKHLKENAFQWWLDGKVDNLYDSTNIMSEIFREKWMYAEYKENQGKDLNQRKEDYELIYRGQTSPDKMTEDLKVAMKNRFPAAAVYIDNDFDKIVNDIKKYSDKYDPEMVGDLSRWALDTLKGADNKYTNEQFIQDLEDRINNCYVSKCKYVEFDNKGRLQQTFDARDPGQVAQAARVAAKDYVYNIGTTEYWAKGKKEALEAPGGVINVLENSVRSTLDLPEDAEISYRWQMDEQHNDITSTPIFTVNNKNYQVIPNENDDGFKLAVINPGVETREINGKVYEVRNNQLQEVQYIPGKTRDYAGERAAEKKAKKEDQKLASREIATIRKERVEAVNKAIIEKENIPEAMKAVGTISREEWEDVKNVEDRITLLNINERRINEDAKKVTEGTMHADDFYKKYRIKYYKWNEAQGQHEKYQLILDSK